ncbi:flagellar P-ring protein precursor FlgI [Pseudomonas nitritireducens]|uniref:Flagellar P-ring protein n=2 Tax=Pseudomonas nitroreducens TaxID=46680 RepID=A0A7W7P317_PSENT|nr:flagellar P-ring protein precursor FlgI [Pseudomonas nitritireducens]
MAEHQPVLTGADMMKFALKSMLLAPIMALGLALAPAAQAEKVGELADIGGVRDNALTGYGLVVGLDGTGDQTTQTPFTGQGLLNMLSSLGITVPPGTNMQLKNIAAVMVTTRMPAFTRPGQKLDVVVSSIGNAKSLRGGTLLMTPLKGLDGQVYAMAQGNLMGVGAGASAGGSSVAINQQDGGRIQNGATVERAIEVELASKDSSLDLQLKNPDFGLAGQMVSAINDKFGRTVASAVDAGLIRLDAPSSPNARVAFIGRVNGIDVLPPEALPKVVINSRTGAVVLNGGVKLYKAAVAHGNLSIVIDTDTNVSQPGALSNGQTVATRKSNIKIDETGRGLHVIQGSADLASVVKALNALGTTPQDLMTILEALKAAGSLRAELEII